MSKTIKAGQTLTARSIGDSECVFQCEVTERNGNFVNVKCEGQYRRKKVYKDENGNEYIFAMGKFSMCPIFRAIN